MFILFSSGFFSNPGVRFIPARVKQFALKRVTLLFERNGICNFWCRVWEKSDIVLILLLKFSLLYREKTDSISYKQQVTIIVQLAGVSTVTVLCGSGGLPSYTWSGISL